MWRKMPIVAGMLAMLATAAAASAQAVTTEVDLSAGEPGQPPMEFDFARTGRGEPGTWTVVVDATATKGRALAQTGADRTDYRFPLAIYKPFSGADVEVTVRFKPVDGTVDRAGGIAVRLSSPDDYYVVRANALEGNVRFYRVVEGKRIEIAGADVKVAAAEWHTMSLRAEADRFTVSFDGKRLFAAKDRTFADAGKVALWTKADSVTYFDGMAITKLR
jgi:hypothetical protein